MYLPNAKFQSITSFDNNLLQIEINLFPLYVHFYFSILDFHADLLSTSISVDKILFISLVGICHTSAPYTKML